MGYKKKSYAPTREEGRKNLKKLDDGRLRNQHGVTFTTEERRALQNAVKRVNRMRDKQLKIEADLPRSFAGKPTGDKVGSLQLMGKESDFILAKRTASMQRFQSRAQFESYLSRLEKVQEKDYIAESVRLYKRNHMEALKNAYGDEAKDIMMKIRMMPRDKYMEMVQKDEALEISYVYDPTERAGKLNAIRSALGMRLKEEALEEE